MRYAFLLLLFQVPMVVFAQTNELKTTTLKQVFEQSVGGLPNDSCTVQEVKIEITFSGNVQRVIPKRAKRLNEVIRSCGIKSTQDWTRGTSELSVYEDETRYWLQLEHSAADKILSKFTMGDLLVIYGRVIARHSGTTTSFLIVEKIAFKE